MLKFQEDVDEETGCRVLTCFLLPQQAYHTESMGPCWAVYFSGVALPSNRQNQIYDDCLQCDSSCGYFLQFQLSY